MFSRRDYKNGYEEMLNDIKNHKERIDVALFCGGSSNDAFKFVPDLAKIGISTVDSYDNHTQIASGTYINEVSKFADKSQTTAIIGAGWDPGYLSLQRVLNNAILPVDNCSLAAHNTFYGGENGGLSMGHSNAVRQIAGVKSAVQLTVSRKDAIEKALNGENVDKYDRHKRVCFVVAEQKDRERIENEIRNIPDYFLGQETYVNFISQEEFDERFSNFTAHSGQQISANDKISFNVELKTKSNMDLTASVMIAYAKANFEMQKRRIYGVFTVADVPLSFLVDAKTHFDNI
jgi:diaminopimelate dehydrogenase